MACASSSYAPASYFGDPDADQAAREVVTLAENMLWLAAEVFLNHAALELDAVCAVPGHGLHPSKAQPPGQIAISQLSGSGGALQKGAFAGNTFNPRHPNGECRLTLRLVGRSDVAGDIREWLKNLGLGEYAESNF